MSVESYGKAQRVFVVIDKGSAHHGQGSIKRQQGRYEAVRRTPAVAR